MSAFIKVQYFVSFRNDQFQPVCCAVKVNKSVKANKKTVSLPGKNVNISFFILCLALLIVVLLKGTIPFIACLHDDPLMFIKLVKSKV